MFVLESYEWDDYDVSSALAKITALFRKTRIFFLGFVERLTKVKQVKRSNLIVVVNTTKWKGLWRTLS